jgi:hypothetical protein
MLVVVGIFNWRKTSSESDELDSSKLNSSMDEVSLGCFFLGVLSSKSFYSFFEIN